MLEYRCEVDRHVRAEGDDHDDERVGSTPQQREQWRDAEDQGNRTPDHVWAKQRFEDCYDDYRTRVQKVYGCR